MSEACNSCGQATDKHLFLDTSDESHFYGHKPTEYAANFLKEDAKEMLPYVSVCPYHDDSTIAETIYVHRCLQPALAAQSAAGDQ